MHTAAYVGGLGLQLGGAGGTCEGNVVPHCGHGDNVGLGGGEQEEVGGSSAR